MHIFEKMPQISESVNPAVASTVSPWSNTDGPSCNHENKICELEMTADLPEVTSALPTPCPPVPLLSCYWASGSSADSF